MGDVLGMSFSGVKVNYTAEDGCALRTMIAAVFEEGRELCVVWEVVDGASVVFIEIFLW
jgi:hypothetical protein